MPAVRGAHVLSRLCRVVVVVGLLSLLGCSSRDTAPSGHLDAGTVDASPPVDGGTDLGGAIDVCEPSCGPAERCGETGEGNGVDDNCNGRVDEGCMCAAPGVTRPCFAGAPDRRNIGVCADGIETCTEFLIWSDCFGGISPTAEVCDGADNDCNNVTDDGLAGCSSSAIPGIEGMIRRFSACGLDRYTGA